jgi:hypothetical protein
MRLTLAARRKKTGVEIFIVPLIILLFAAEAELAKTA